MCAARSPMGHSTRAICASPPSLPFFCLCFVAPFPCTYCAEQSPLRSLRLGKKLIRNAGNCAEVPAAQIAWDSPANVQSKQPTDGAKAKSVATLSDRTNLMRPLSCSTYNAGMPDGATINGIEARIQMANENGKDPNRLFNVAVIDPTLSKAVNVLTGDYNSGWPAETVLGGSDDTWGGTPSTLTVAKVRASAFGFHALFSGETGGSNPAELWVDWIGLRVHWAVVNSTITNISPNNISTEAGQVSLLVTGSGFADLSQYQAQTGVTSGEIMCRFNASGQVESTTATVETASRGAGAQVRCPSPSAGFYTQAAGTVDVQVSLGNNIWMTEVLALAYCKIFRKPCFVRSPSFGVLAFLLPRHAPPRPTVLLSSTSHIFPDSPSTTGAPATTAPATTAPATTAPATTTVPATSGAPALSTTAPGTTTMPPTTTGSLPSTTGSLTTTALPGTTGPSATSAAGGTTAPPSTTGAATTPTTTGSTVEESSSAAATDEFPWWIIVIAAVVCCVAVVVVVVFARRNNQEDEDARAEKRGEFGGLSAEDSVNTTSDDDVVVYDNVGAVMDSETSSESDESSGEVVYAAAADVLEG
jgi:hypothetical protein